MKGSDSSSRISTSSCPSSPSQSLPAVGLFEVVSSLSSLMLIGVVRVTGPASSSSWRRSFSSSLRREVVVFAFLPGRQSWSESSSSASVKRWFFSWIPNYDLLDYKIREKRYYVGLPLPFSLLLRSESVFCLCSSNIPEKPTSVQKLK